jgi:myosin heavy subunit
MRTLRLEDPHHENTMERLRQEQRACLEAKSEAQQLRMENRRLEREHNEFIERSRQETKRRDDKLVDLQDQVRVLQRQLEVHRPLARAADTERLELSHHENTMERLRQEQRVCLEAKSEAQQLRMENRRLEREHNELVEHIELIEHNELTELSRLRFSQRQLEHQVRVSQQQVEHQRQLTRLLTQHSQERQLLELLEPRPLPFLEPTCIFTAPCPGQMLHVKVNDVWLVIVNDNDGRRIGNDDIMSSPFCNSRYH